MNITTEILGAAALIDVAHWATDTDAIRAKMAEMVTRHARDKRGWLINPADVIFWDDQTEKSASRGQVHVNARWMPQRLELLRGPRDGERLDGFPGALTISRTGHPPDRITFMPTSDAYREQTLLRPDDYLFVGINTDDSRLVYQWQTSMKASTP